MPQMKMIEQGVASGLLGKVPADLNRQDIPDAF